MGIWAKHGLRYGHKHSKVTIYSSIQTETSTSNSLSSEVFTF